MPLYLTLLNSYFTNDFDGGIYDSHVIWDELRDSVYNMLSGIESQTFKWSISKEAMSEVDYGPRLGSFCIDDAAKGRLRFPSCGLVSFDAALEELMLVGTRFRRLEAVAAVLEKSLLYVVFVNS
jgi:hypothetical protein